MLLLIDAGNTRIKWALVAADAGPAWGNWIASGAVPHSEISRLTEAWQGRQIERALLSNVAGQSTGNALQHIVAYTCGAALDLFQSQAEAGGLCNGYRTPTQLGSDRFASAIGAHALYPKQHLIVATCGTATTVDAVTAEGDFLGGMILPGLGLMASSLAKNTAQLPQVAQLVGRAPQFADNTDEAIISGCISAQAGAIERAATAMAQRYGTVQCIISGGAAAWVAPYVALPCETVDNLVLIGLQVAAFS